MKYFELKHPSPAGTKGEFIEEFYYKAPIRDENFIGNHYNGKIIDFSPIIPAIEIGRFYRVPDLFSPGGSIAPRLVLSDLLKEILIENGAEEKIQFFPIILIQEGRSLNNFWITNFFSYDNEFIDFKNSLFVEEIVTREGNRFIQLKFNSKFFEKRFKNLDEFIKRVDELYNANNSITTKKLQLLESCDKDVLILDECMSLDIIVSERIKLKIEEKGLYGIEFKPLEISDEEWYGPNGLRKQFYK